MEREPWERQPGESSKAYRAFSVYLRMGVQRSVDSAWALFCAERAVGVSSANKAIIGPRFRHASAPGHWRDWITRWRWVERVQAREDHIARARDAALEAKRIELDIRRMEWEFASQAKIERQCDLLEAKRDKLLEMPNVSIEDKKVDSEGKVASHRKIGGLRPGELVKVCREIRESHAAAINGPTPLHRTIRLENAGDAEAGGQVVQAVFHACPPPEGPNNPN